ncbi:MAG: AAA family ATPase [Lentisphaeraceae bacterium]|nr:AAA family ATPase [Lentisphaeraceae bacterium]
MKIKSIELCNFRATKNLKLSFSSQLNVLVGINGGGKSTVLDALAFNLSWLVNRIQRAGVSGRPIPEGSIRNGESQAYLDLWVEWDQQSFRWALQRTIQGRNAEELSKLDGASQLAKILQERHEKSESLPVVVYYPVNRIIGSTTPELSSKDSIYALDIYEDSLGGKSNFRSFFEWFRIQDDIVNEHAQYSSKWLARNSHQFRRGVKNALKKLQGELISREMYVNEEAFFSVNDLLKDDVVFKKPTFLFRELVRWVERIEVPHFKQHVELFHEFDYMLHRLLSMSNDYRDIPEDSFNEIYLDVLERTLHKVFNFCGTNSPLGFFMWDIFSCANSLSLWWMSDLGRKEVERVFRGARNDLKRSPLYLSDTSFLTSMMQILKKELIRK